MNERTRLFLSGCIAGAVNGLFGAGGGMLLVPLLTGFVHMDEQKVFPSSVSIILPISLISLLIGSMGSGLPMAQALPYLLGGAAGGIFAGIWDNKIPVKWLHRILGIFILWGGYRYLC